jgi:hypothetical protein
MIEKSDLKPYVELEMTECPEKFYKFQRNVEEIKDGSEMKPAPYRLAMNAPKFIGRNNYACSIILDDVSVDQQHVAIYRRPTDGVIIAQCLSGDG